MKEVHLTGRRVALVDDKDYELLGRYEWRARFDKKSRHWYAYRSEKIDGVRRTISMAREILGLEITDKRQADHRDFKATLDNQRSNLRIATTHQNHCNQGMKRNNTSGYKGVMLHKKKAAQKKPWRAAIMVNYKSIHLGYFPTAFDAHLAYKAAAAKYHGEFARCR